MSGKRKKDKGHNKITKKQIHLDKYSLRKLSNMGRDTFAFSVEEGRCIYGVENQKGKYQAFLISPNLNFDSIESELDFDGDFCFVDTNEIKNKTGKCENLTHVTGIFIFKILKIKRSEKYTDATIDLESRNLGFEFFTLKEGRKAEIEGWNFAIEVLKKRKTEKAKIFVDAFQADLKEIGGHMLPRGYNFYYVSADRKHSIFNIIFSRLDKLINKVQNQQDKVGSAEEAYNYLMGQINHL